jgi:hypothetical protein
MTEIVSVNIERGQSKVGHLAMSNKLKSSLLTLVTFILSF